MALRHGTVGEFDHTTEDWEAYVERVELYLTANSVREADRKRAVLLSLCGAKVYRMIRDLAGRRTSATAKLSSSFKNISTRSEE